MIIGRPIGSTVTAATVMQTMSKYGISCVHVDDIYATNVSEADVLALIDTSDTFSIMLSDISLVYLMKNMHDIAVCSSKKLSIGIKGLSAEQCLDALIVYNMKPHSSY